MPQEIRVLCCFKCKIFQVDIVKKANKWQCKLCCEKQSVFKEFFRGTGAECRQKVQELNLCKNGERHKEENELLGLLENNDLEIDLDLAAREEQNHINQSKPTENKWTKYLGDSKENCSEFIQVMQSKNIKRKNTSNSTDTKNFKRSKSTSSTGSQWDAYL